MSQPLPTAPFPAPPPPGPAPAPPLAPNWLACPGVDEKAFRQKCRIPLVGTAERPEWNLWVVERTNRDNATLEEAIDGWFMAQPLAGKLPGLRYVVDYWFRTAFPSQGPSAFGSSFDHLTIATSLDEKLVVENIAHPLGKVIDTQIASARDRERTMCSPYLITVPVVQPGEGFRFYVAFMYRGSQASMPWPVYRFDDYLGLGAYETWCPVADYAVTAAYTLDAGLVRPPPQKVDWKQYLPELPAGLDASKSLTGLAFWGGVGVVTAVLIAGAIQRNI
jgi:hypothetical protein